MRHKKRIERIEHHKKIVSKAIDSLVMFRENNVDELKPVWAKMKEQANWSLRVVNVFFGTHKCKKDYWYYPAETIDELMEL